ALDRVALRQGDGIAAGVGQGGIGAGGLDVDGVDGQGHTAADQLLVVEQRHVAVVSGARVEDIDDVAGCVAAGGAGEGGRGVVAVVERAVAVGGLRVVHVPDAGAEVDRHDPGAGEIVGIGYGVGEAIGEVLVAGDRDIGKRAVAVDGDGAAVA